MCYDSKLMRASILCFIFITRITKGRQVHGFISVCTDIHIQEYSELGVYMQGFIKTLSKTNIFLSSLHLILSTLDLISVVFYTFIYLH